MFVSAVVPFFLLLPSGGEPSFLFRGLVGRSVGGLVVVVFSSGFSLTVVCFFVLVFGGGGLDWWFGSRCLFVFLVASSVSIPLIGGLDWWSGG